MILILTTIQLHIIKWLDNRLMFRICHSQSIITHLFGNVANIFDRLISLRNI